MVEPIKHTSTVVVIPAFNVEHKLAGVIDLVQNYVEKIIVVNDGSTDNTGSLTKKKSNKKIELINHPENRGVGAAMLTGYHRALDLGADIIIKMDGDGQMDPAYIPLLVKPIKNLEADYVKGNRFLHPEELKKMPLLRQIGNLGLTFLTKLASGYWNIFDPTNGFTAIHRDVLKRINQGNIAHDYLFETSMLLELRRVDAIVMDVPIPARYGDEQSSLSPFISLLQFPGKLLNGLIKRIYRQYFLYDFNAVSIYLLLGIPLLLFGVIWGAIKWLISDISGVVASTGTVLIAVLPIIVGIQFLTQAISLDIASVPISSARIREPNMMISPPTGEKPDSRN